MLAWRPIRGVLRCDGRTHRSMRMMAGRWWNGCRVRAEHSAQRHADEREYRDKS